MPGVVTREQELALIIVPMVKSQSESNRARNHHITRIGRNSSRVLEIKQVSKNKSHTTFC